jgi:quinoprotein glucose dehydrogenase
MTQTLAKAAWLSLLLTSVVLAGDDFAEWRHYGGDPGNTHYSSLPQINTDNVNQLQLAWSYHSAHGENIHPTSELQINPIIINGVLYGRNPQHNVFAVNAATGAEIWRWDPRAEKNILLGAYMRGLAYWQEGDHATLLVNVANYLVALNPRTGQLRDNFGDNGWVDLKQNLGRDPAAISIYAPSPGIVYKDLIIIGTATTEGDGAAPGHIRAYDVRSGKMRWIFHTIPQPGEFGHDSWPKDAWKTAGGANAWAGLSLDEQRGVVYIPTGSPTPDFNGQDRHGSNLYGNTIIALNAQTGERKWHFQTVHHDLWDRDLSSPPSLVTLNQGGKSIAALAQASKQGVVYLLDRETGEPVFPITEVAVPGSDVPGEQSWPTQPLVSLPEPFTRQAFTRDQITDITPEATSYVQQRYDTAQEFARYRPVGLQPTIVFPGFPGGANWGGGAVDPTTGTYYINAMESPHLVKMVPVEVPAGEDSFGFGRYIYQKYCSGCHGANREGFYPYAPALVNLEQRIGRNQASSTIINGRGRMMPFGNLPAHERQAVVEYLFSADKQPENTSSRKSDSRTEYVFGGYADFLDDRGYPAIKPPWGTLTAIDLNSGKRKWQIPLGEIAALSKEGVPPTGTFNYGGPLITAGNLLIIAATNDEYIRAFDKRDGSLLWQYKLPAAGYATPASYEVNGKQFIVIAAGGGKLGSQSVDQYLAFALPENQ